MNKQKVFLSVLFASFVFCNLLSAQNSTILTSLEIEERKTEKVNPTRENIATKQLQKIEYKSYSSNGGINYQLDNSGFVSIKIFNYNNREITSLVNRDQKADHYYTNFSTINLSSGIYRYCISVDGESVCSRMLFIN